MLLHRYDILTMNNENNVFYKKELGKLCFYQFCKEPKRIPRVWAVFTFYF